MNIINSIKSQDHYFLFQINCLLNRNRNILRQFQTVVSIFPSINIMALITQFIFRNLDVMKLTIGSG